MSRAAPSRRAAHAVKGRRCRIGRQLDVLRGDRDTGEVQTELARERTGERTRQGARPTQQHADSGTGSNAPLSRAYRNEPSPVSTPPLGTDATSLATTVCGT